MQEYVLGFLFTIEHPGFIVLLKKKFPKWQEGLLNGVGGKIDTSDKDSYTAMDREWREETGLDVSIPWNYFANIGDNKFRVHCFRYETNETDFFELEEKLPSENDVGEKFEIRDLQILLDSEKHEMIPNLQWLLPLAFDKDYRYTEAQLH
jgi:8-oxo-dGTP diphosphatase